MVRMCLLPIVVTIPVKNEEAQIGACLDSLARQTRRFDRLVLLLNNCTDATLKICEQVRNQSQCIEIYEETLHGHLASAGEARRLALHFAAQTGPNCIILTTDADAAPERFWIEKNIREMETGAEVVCGMAQINPQDATNIPRTLHDDDMRETFLLAALDEITALMNPDPFDPWPRHQQQSGASIAVRRDVLHLAGGPPQVATCEDRVLIERLRLVDARIRHAPDLMVQVSGRLEGRASGGMAETIKRRMIRQDVFTDEKLEPAVDAFRRAVAQARLRAVRQGKADGISLARDLLIHPAAMNRILQARFHGQAWAEMQAASPVLQRRRVAFADLARQIRIALEFRDKLLSNNAPTRKRHLAATIQMFKTARERLLDGIEALVPSRGKLQFSAIRILNSRTRNLQHRQGLLTSTVQAISSTAVGASIFIGLTAATGRR
jgi:GT2 family glycosyltransferase